MVSCQHQSYHLPDLCLRQYHTSTPIGKHPTYHIISFIPSELVYHHNSNCMKPKSASSWTSHPLSTHPHYSSPVSIRSDPLQLAKHRLIQPIRLRTRVQNEPKYPNLNLAASPLRLPPPPVSAPPPIAPAYDFLSSWTAHDSFPTRDSTLHFIVAIQLNPLAFARASSSNQQASRVDQRDRDETEREEEEKEISGGSSIAILRRKEIMNEKWNLSGSLRHKGIYKNLDGEGQNWTSKKWKVWVMRCENRGQFISLHGDFLKDGGIKLKDRSVSPYVHRNKCD